MSKLELEATTKTPQISLDAESGMMVIRGRSIPGDAEEFWSQVIQWFEGYAKNPAPHTSVKIDLEYFNISSSKQLLLLLYKLNDMNNSERHTARIEWHYSADDKDMYEVGQDYAFMVKVPFEFIQQREHQAG